MHNTYTIRVHLVWSRVPRARSESGSEQSEQSGSGWGAPRAPPSRGSSWSGPGAARVSRGRGRGPGPGSARQASRAGARGTHLLHALHLLDGHLLGHGLEARLLLLLRAAFPDDRRSSAGVGQLSGTRVGPRGGREVAQSPGVRAGGRACGGAGAGRRALLAVRCAPRPPLGPGPGLGLVALRPPDAIVGAEQTISRDRESGVAGRETATCPPAVLLPSTRTRVLTGPLPPVPRPSSPALRP